MSPVGKSPHQITDLETKVRVVKDSEGEKSVMDIACQSGISHSTVGTILKNKNKVTELLKYLFHGR